MVQSANFPLIWWEMKTNPHGSPFLVQPFSLTVHFCRLSWPFVIKHESSTSKKGFWAWTLGMEQALLFLKQLVAGSGRGAKHSCKPPCGRLKHLHTTVCPDTAPHQEMSRPASRETLHKEAAGASELLLNSAYLSLSEIFAMLILPRQRLEPRGTEIERLLPANRER